MGVDLSRWVTMADAGRILGRNERTIRRRVKDGILKRDAKKRVQLGQVIEALKVRADARGKKLSVYREAKPDWLTHNEKSLKASRAAVKAHGLSPARSSNRFATISLPGLRTMFTRWQVNEEKNCGSPDRWNPLIRKMVMDEIEPMYQLWMTLKKLP